MLTFAILRPKTSSSQYSKANSQPAAGETMLTFCLSGNSTNHQELTESSRKVQKGKPKNIFSTKYDPVSPTLLAVHEIVAWNITEATSFGRLNHLTQGTLCNKRLSEERVGVTVAPFSLLQHAATKLIGNNQLISLLGYIIWFKVSWKQRLY